MKLNAIILFGLLSLAACKKDATTYCWSCTYNGYTNAVYTPATVCDKTEADIAQYQIDNDLMCTKQ